MSSWNYDITQAPKGRYEKVTRVIKGVEHVHERHVPEYIIAAGNEGVVNLSRWLPDEGR
jgi:hypothetical protein